MQNRPEYYVGVDTHKYIHTACILNYDMDNLLTFTFDNIPSEYDEAMNKILEVTKCDDIIFGLEDVQSFGLLFSHCVSEKGYIVKHVNPASASVYRNRQSNYYKTDDYDTYCVAKVLKDDYKKLHQQLEKVYPGYTKFFCEIQTRSALAFYKHFPSARYLEGYTSETLTIEMKRYTKIFKESTAKKILDTVNDNPVPFADEVIESTIIDLIDDIYDREEKIKELDTKLEPLIKETGYKLETIPGVSITMASSLISIIQNVDRFKTPSKLARYSGIAPVPVGSGGKHKEKSSKKGHRGLRAIFYRMAVGMIAVNKTKEARYPMYRDYYLKKLSEGKTTSQAMVCLMRQLVNLIHSMMKNKTEWRPSQYQD